MESVSTVKSDEPSSSELRMAFIGGGSGGHLFPAIAVGNAIRQLYPSAKFLFLCSRRPVDQQILATPKWPAGSMVVDPYVRMAGHQAFFYRIALIPEWLSAYRTAKKSLAMFKPHVAVGLGASASVPGMIAASHLRIPLALMEQNTIPGKANHLLAKRAAVTLAGMPFDTQTSRRWPSPLVVTGTPVRLEIARLSQAMPKFSGRCRLLILGGSQGSASVNRLVLEALADEHCIPSDWQIIHQTGTTGASGSAGVSRIRTTWTHSNCAEFHSRFARNAGHCHSGRQSSRRRDFAGAGLRRSSVHSDSTEHFRAESSAGKCSATGKKRCLGFNHGNF